MKKEYFIILDTETANSLEQPLPYDLGWVVTDRQGNIYESRSYVIFEIFYGERDLMETAYYAEKLPQYHADIKAGKRKCTSIWSVRKAFREDMERYNIKKVGAYNMFFDMKALNNDMRYITKSFARWFFPYGTEFFCIWNMACTCLMNRPTFIKFAEKNGFMSEKGNIQTSAEVCYRYITKDAEFIESHTGLEDVLIETAIMAHCYRQHKPFESKPNPGCWQVVQKVKKNKDGKNRRPYSPKRAK